MKIDIKMKPSKDVIKNLGIGAKGDIQLFTTHEIRRRMTRYMPYRTGTTSGKLTYVEDPTHIKVNAPYAERLYNGVNKNGKPLRYTKTFNPLAGPRWDKTMLQAEGDSIKKSIENYSKRRAGR